MLRVETQPKFLSILPLTLALPPREEMHGKVRDELAEVEQPVTIRVKRLEERAGLVFFSGEIVSDSEYSCHFADRYKDPIEMPPYLACRSHWVCLGP